MRRFFFAWIVHLVFLSAAFAQVTGRVESIGLEGVVRPDAWTPMVVQLQASSPEATTFQLQVVQYDLDGDEVVFTRPVAVTSTPQNYWMYFRPEPIRRGLFSAAGADLQKRLRVYVAEAGSGKRLLQLPLGSGGSIPLTNLGENGRRGTKLILCVGRSPSLRDFNGEEILGTLENILFLVVDPRKLPESVLGYDAIDGILWTDAPTDLDDAQMTAIRRYVRGGGRLIITQQAQWQRSAAFGDMLPVDIAGVENVSKLEPLLTLARIDQQPADDGRAPGSPAPPGPRPGEPAQPAGGKGPPQVPVARATLLPGALVDRTIDLPDAKASPWLVRRTYELGSVTWVAQDLSDPNLSAVAQGWPFVWNAVLDLADTPQLGRTAQNVDRWRSDGSRDIGTTLLNGWGLTGRSTGLVTLAFVFFVVYWAVAGPGNYFILAARRRTAASWFVFGAIALLATLLTLGVVRLVLRGQPEVAHLSLVQATADPQQPARVRSRFGLYIPRSGTETISLSDVSNAGVTTLTPFAINPAHRKDDPRLRDTEYLVPVSDLDQTDRVAVDIPYRSTLKKLQLDWTGPLKGRVTGEATLQQKGFIAGRLTNRTGRDLRNIYVAFRYPAYGGQYQDWMLYLPAWQAGSDLDLNAAFNTLDDGKMVPFLTDDLTPDNGQPVRGQLPIEWSNFFARKGLTRPGDLLSDSYDDSAARVRPSIPFLTFFDHIRPQPNVTESTMGFGGTRRANPLRRGARAWNLSGTLSAGGLIVVAEADEVPIPAPLKVDGSPVEGVGTVVYQFVLPIDRTDLLKQYAAEEATSK